MIDKIDKIETVYIDKCTESLRCEKGSSVAAAHKEVEAEKCHSAR